MKRLISVLVCLLTFFLAGGNSSALQVVRLVEGENAFVQISMKDLNVIKTDIAGVKAFTSSHELDVRVEGKIIFVKYTGTIPETQELVLLGSSGSVYTLILKPTAIPSETIVISTGEKMKKVAGTQLSQPYIKSLKDLIRGMYTDVPPPGYSVETRREDRTRWNEASLILEKVYRSPLYVGEVYSLRAKAPVVLDEREFYSQGVLAVSIERHELKEGEETKVYVVRSAAK